MLGHGSGSVWGLGSIWLQIYALFSAFPVPRCLSPIADQERLEEGKKQRIICRYQPSRRTDWLTAQPQKICTVIECECQTLYMEAADRKLQVASLLGRE